MQDAKASMAELKLQPGTLSEMIQLIEGGTISGKIAKQVLPALLKARPCLRAVLVLASRGLVAYRWGLSAAVSQLAFLNAAAPARISSATHEESCHALCCRMLDVLGAGAHERGANAQGEGQDGLEAYVQSRGLAQISDAAAIEAMVDKVLAQCPKELEQYRGGKTKLQGHFVG